MSAPRHLLAISLLLPAACAPELAAPEGGPAPADEVSLAPPNKGLQLRLGPVEYPPFTEAYYCALLPLENPRELPIVALEHQGSALTHHFNAYLIAETIDAPVEGDCGDVWDHVSMGLSSPIYASQTLSFRGDFPEGVAGRLPTGNAILLEYHALNPFDEPRIGEAVLNIHAGDRAEIETYANGLFGSNANIELAPHSRTVVSRDCYVDTDMNLFVFGSHTHRLAEAFEIFTLSTLGHLGERVYYSDDWQTPLLDIRSDDPVFIPAGAGLQFRCTYYNDTDNTVTYGDDSSDEMCMMAGVYYPDDGFKFCRRAPPSGD